MGYPDPEARKEAQKLIARQIALHDGYIWRDGDSKTPQQARKQTQLWTLAGNILATVERNLGSFKWP